MWEALRTAITDAGFVIVNADVFDKQHGTFKHFVSENTAGADLVLHCLSRKPGSRRAVVRRTALAACPSSCSSSMYRPTYSRTCTLHARLRWICAGSAASGFATRSHTGERYSTSQSFVST